MYEHTPQLTASANARYKAALAKYPNDDDLGRAYAEALFALNNLETQIKTLTQSKHDNV